jgi:2-dehydro-3-deoxyphosphogluconate aldolase/(4S)-4-hydroxy-2-oxoglutarate aldolase
MTSPITDIVGNVPVIPVLVVDRVEVAAPLAEALVAGGLEVLEITLRTPVALEVIRAMKAAVPRARIGVGTVLTEAQLNAAIEAGASFAVSPGATAMLLEAAGRSSIPLLPGTSTASEVMELLERGWRHMKLFPAEAVGGAKLLESLASPLPEARFCPTGGIDLAKAPSYLRLPNVFCVGGSWVAPKDAVAKGDWARIETLAREAAALRG